MRSVTTPAAEELAGNHRIRSWRAGANCRRFMIWTAAAGNSVQTARPRGTDPSYVSSF
jgi:hypothetical protein